MTTLSSFDEVHTTLGLTHAADSIYRRAVPQEYVATVHDIHRFAAVA